MYALHPGGHLHFSTPLVTILTMKAGKRRASCGSPGIWQGVGKSVFLPKPMCAIDQVKPLMKKQ